jgi:hypothetical protein
MDSSGVLIEWLGLFFTFSLLPILITWWMGKWRDRHGWVWGLVLGWLGVILLALNLPPKRERRQRVERAQAPTS